MKNLKRVIFGIIFLALIGLLVYLYTNNIVLAKSSFENLNLAVYIILFIIFLYYLVFYSIRPTYIKRFKIINTFIGLAVIYIAQRFVVNSGIEGVYYGDILCLIGVILTIIGPTNLLVSQKLQERKESQTVEIIEA